MLLAWDALAPFNREAWDQGREIVEIGDNPRQGLYVEAMSRLPPGTPRATVRGLLGPAEGGSYLTDLPTDTYALGTSRWGIDPETLVIEYDSADKVVRWWIERG